MKPLKIVPPEIQDGDTFCKAQGTEVYSGDQKIHGIESLDVSFRVDDLVRATVKLCCWFEELDGAEPVVKMTHPFTGEEVQVAGLLLSNGRIVDFSVDAEEVAIDSDGEQPATRLDSCAYEFRKGSVKQPRKSWIDWGFHEIPMEPSQPDPNGSNWRHPHYK